MSKNTQSNIEKYKKDIDSLIKKGEKILLHLKNNRDLDWFRKEYEIWYSESLSLIKIVLPNRATDFERYYYQKGESCLKDCIVYTSKFDDFLGDRAEESGIIFENQLGIVKSAKKRFDSSLFDIRQLVQADLFDSELDAARELNKKGFVRGSGTIAGVVLEAHLAQVCENHNIKMKKKNPSINDYNQLLKNNEVIDIKDWRFIQHLADLRNLCDHKKKKEPTREDIEDLIKGVEKIIKTIF